MESEQLIDYSTENHLLQTIDYEIAAVLIYLPSQKVLHTRQQIKYQSKKKNELDQNEKHIINVPVVKIKLHWDTLICFMCKIAAKLNIPY